VVSLPILMRPHEVRLILKFTLKGMDDGLGHTQRLGAKRMCGFPPHPDETT
jgi:hypothetical protein